MKITLSQIFNNKPYYTIEHEDGRVNYAFGCNQAQKFVDGAKSRNENVKIEDIKFLKEHTKLINKVENERQI